MTFEYPWRLIAGALVALLLAIAYVRSERRNDAQALGYSNLTFFLDAVKPRTWIPAALRWGFVAALACCAIAAGGPQMTLPMPARDGTVWICIDTSGSMQSTDVQPTRSGAAQEAARAFIREAAPGTKIGIIAFSSAASVVQPLSADRAAVLQAVDQIPSPNGATAIGDALRLAASDLPPSGHRIVILVTDGVNNTVADPQEMAEYLGAHHVPVYTVGIGTPNGDVIGGEQSTIDESALQSYAQASGGAYAHAENARELRDALARLGRVTSIQRQNVPAALGFLYAGVALFVCTLLAGLGVGRFP